MKPLFENRKEYSIQVGTPSGAGRIVKPGEAVEGDYFESSWRAGMPITKLTEEEAIRFDKRKVLMSISLGEGITQAEAAVPSIETVQAVAPEATLNIKNETSTNRTLEDTINQAVKEMGTSIPTWKELNNMSIEQLNALAVRYNISSVGTRGDLLKQLKARLVPAV